MSSIAVSNKRPRERTASNYSAGGSINENDGELIADCAEQTPDMGNEELSKYRKVNGGPSIWGSDTASTLTPVSNGRPSDQGLRNLSTIKDRERRTQEAIKIWRKCKAVCFDVDSTVCTDEAIDELAIYLGVGTKVADWTRKAMNGNYSFREALKARLDLIKPSRQQLEEYVNKHPPKLTPGIKELVKELHHQNKAVYLVSGGFTRIILPVAKLLNVPEENVFANVLHFDENGTYSGFDDSQPTSDSGGKTEVCQMLKSKFLYSPLAMVGDGATDMEASPPADVFIGFGGNQVREGVKNGAHWFTYSFLDLVEELRRQQE